MKHLITFTLALSLTACASFNFSEEQWQQAVQTKITEWDLQKTSRIRAGQLRSFSNLGEHFVIIRAGVNRPYLIQFNNRCHELEWAQQIKATDHLNAGFDSIYFGKTPQMGCRVKHIYSLTREQDIALQNLEQQAAEQQGSEHQSG